MVEKRTGREYAAKIIDLSTENTSDAQAADLRTAARREIALLLKLQGHPNISTVFSLSISLLLLRISNIHFAFLLITVELHEVFETSTFIFLVFEICKRGELFDYLTQYVRLSERRTRDFMRQLFDALSYIHERQCVHRDVKPGSRF